MNTITVALEDMKAQLIAAVRGSLDSGFELIAEVAGAKMVKAMEEAVKAAQDVAAAAGDDRGRKEAAAAAVGVGDIAGLRAQILDNAAILIPLTASRSRTHTRTRTRTNAAVPVPVCDHCDPFDFANNNDNGIRIVTMGTPSTGTRAMLFAFDAAHPRPNTRTLRCWSRVHATLAAALKDLLEVTEGTLTIHLSPRLGTKSPKTSSEEFWAKAATKAPDASFETDRDATPKAEGLGIHSEKGKLFWDASMTTNPHFKGFDYGSFDSGFASNGPMGGERGPEKKGGW